MKKLVELKNGAVAVLHYAYAERMEYEQLQKLVAKEGPAATLIRKFMVTSIELLQREYKASAVTLTFDEFNEINKAKHVVLTMTEKVHAQTEIDNWEW